MGRRHRLSRPAADAGRPLATAGRRPRQRTLRDGGGGRAVHACRRAERRRARAGAPVASRRGGAGAPLRRRGDADGAPPGARGAARRRRAGGRARVPRLPVVDSLGDVVDPAEHGAHRGLGVPGSRARGGRERGEGRARISRWPNIEPVGASEDVLARGAPRRQKRSAASSSRSFVLGARVQAAFDRSRFQEAATLSDRRLALLPGIDDPDHLCEAYEAGSPAAAAVVAASTTHGVSRSSTPVSRERLSAHHRVHSVSLELELADALGDWARLAAQTDRASTRDRGEPRHAVRAQPARPPPLRSRAPLPRRRGAGASSWSATRMRIAGEGYETYLSGPRLRIALERGDRASLESLVELPVERALVWGPGMLRRAAGRARRARARTTGSSARRLRCSSRGRPSSRSRSGRSAAPAATTSFSRRPTTASPRSGSTGTPPRLERLLAGL